MSEMHKRRAAAARGGNSAYQDRIAEIRQAASRVFHKRGFHATTLGDVAIEAKMDRTTLYYYVGSKQQLFRDVVKEALTANIEGAERIAASSAPTVEKISDIIRELMVSFEQTFPFMYVFVQEDATKLSLDANRDDEWLSNFREFNTRYFSALNSIMVEGIANGTLNTPLPTKVLLNCLIGIINSSRAWFTPNGPMDATEIAAGMTQLFLHGVASNSPAASAQTSGPILPRSE